MSAFLLVTVLCAAGARGPESAAADAEDPVESRIQVVTTLPVLADLARRVGGARIEVEALSAAGQDPHFVSPRPTLMKKARRADVFIEIGLQLELWAQKVVDGAGNPRIQHGQPGRIVASRSITTIEIPEALSRDQGDVHPYGNPHIWLDPLRAIQMARNIESGLAQVSPSDRTHFERKRQEFEDEAVERLFGPDLVEQIGASKLQRLAMQDLLGEYLERKRLTGALGGWMARVAPLKGRPIVTYHKTWGYLADRFGFVIPIEIEEKPGIPPSARHRDRVLDLMREQSARVILMANFYSRKAPDYLADETGATVVAAHLDVAPDRGVFGYFELIDEVLSALLEADRRQDA